MNEIKKCIVPGLLALVGVRLASMVAPASQAGQLIAGAAGAIGGVFLATKL
jgi:hypothetical protein